MTTPTEPLTADQLTRTERHIRSLDHEIDGKCTEQRIVTGHALARIAQATHPGTITATVHDIGDAGRFGMITFDTRAGIEHCPQLPPEMTTALTAMLRRLPAGATGIWDRDGETAILDVTAALPLGDRSPFLPVQDRLLAHLEEKTGRAIRSIEIGTDLWEDGYFFTDTVEVNYADGDGDNVGFR